MKEQIEEMTKVLKGMDRFDEARFGFYESYARAIYNAGYRKQSDDEMFRELDCFKNAIMDAFLSLCDYNDYNKINLLLIGNTIDRIYEDVVSKMKGADNEQREAD
jgi:hypothetical protein